MKKTLSIIIPARNEEVLIGQCLAAVLEAAGQPGHLAETDIEVIVVDNASTDRTPSIVRRFAERAGVGLIQCDRPTAPCARNAGAAAATGGLLLFVDADTLIPPQALDRVRAWAGDGCQAGISWYESLEGGHRAWFWWTFWCLIRLLPIPHAKAMPAFMFCTREAFERFGPFDERIVIGEEWPILSGVFCAAPDRFIYDPTLVVRTSSRRMELQPFGYARTFFRYLWAVLHHSGRYTYSDQWRQDPAGAGALSRGGGLSAGDAVPDSLYATKAVAPLGALDD